MPDPNPAAPARHHSTSDVVLGHLNGSIVLVPQRRGHQLIAIRRAVASSETWGDLRAAIPEELRHDLDQLHGDDPVPDDAVPLADRPVPGWDDGDWPGSPAQEMLEWVPKAVRALGTVEQTTLNGPYLELAPDREPAILEALLAASFTAERDDAFVELVVWG